MRTILLLFFLLAGPLYAAQDYSAKTEVILRKIVHRLARQSVDGERERLQLVTKDLLGRPYGFNNPSGEGLQGEFDRSDLFNLEELNCTTFVEAALAISLTEFDFDEPLVSQLLPQLIDIKYRDGVVRFVSRNHFTSIDWVPNVTDKHILQDVTEQLSNDVRRQHASLNIQQWYESKITHAKSAQVQEQLRTYRQLYPHAEAVEAELDYIPLKAMLSAEVMEELKRKKIVVFNMVKEKKAGIPVIVAHQGFIVLKGRHLVFRHASTTGKVKDSSYKRYIKARMHDRKWKTLGFNILELDR